MSSSDSDDCYGNIAQKLQSLKNQYVEEKYSSIYLVEDGNSDLKTSADVNLVTIASEEFNTTLNSTDSEEWTLDAIIAKNTNSKPGRKRKTDVTSETAVACKTRRKTANSNKKTDSISEDTAEYNAAVATRRGRSSRKSNNSSSTPNTSPRGNRGTARRSTTNRGRGRGRNSRNNSSRGSQQVDIYPIYSIGNTDDYPDECGNQELFSTNPSTNNDVEIIEEDPLEDDNEELSVKVYWQSLEVVRFKIRKYQKLKPIFKYFSERENVVLDKLLLMYNDRIIKIDDTPDSIDYNIAKFIDGGIVERNVTGLIKETKEEVQNGLRIKFQCQNIKKPFETIIRPEDKLGLAMIKCSEHLETPINRMKFYFDGDLISSKTTAEELELEGGECIDVKIISS